MVAFHSISSFALSLSSTAPLLFGPKLLRLSDIFFLPFSKHTLLKKHPDTCSEATDIFPPLPSPLTYPEELCIVTWTHLLYTHMDVPTHLAGPLYKTASHLVLFFSFFTQHFTHIAILLLFPFKLCFSVFKLCGLTPFICHVHTLEYGVLHLILSRTCMCSTSLDIPSHKKKEEMTTT